MSSTTRLPITDHTPLTPLRLIVETCLALSLTLIALHPSVSSAQPEEMTSQGIDFVKITSGQFIAGSPSAQLGRIDNERERRVPLNHEFWISKYEITQAQWEDVMGSNPSSFRALGPDRSYPVETISWHDAQNFIAALNTAEGGDYFRLPTEAEWEYVAKANTHGSWSFGDLEALLGDYTYRDGAHKPYRAGDKLANAWGVYDLYGNVYEWCEDWYQKWVPPSRGACPPAEGTYKVIRGGSRAAASRYLRSSSRNFALPERRGYYIGLRLVRVMDPLNDPYRSGVACAPPAFCGDGIVNGAEECDDGDLDDQDECDASCTLTGVGGDPQGDPGGDLCAEGQHVVNQVCSPCAPGTTRPAGDDPAGDDTECAPIGCGDGVLNEEEEECDLGAGNSYHLSDTCRPDCRLPHCGDGVLDAGEACDNGDDTFLVDFCDEQCNPIAATVPLLVLIIDFNDSDTDGLLPNSEQAWSDLIFGDQQGQGNHYWSEVFDQQFSTTPVVESAGNANDGVIRVQVSASRPSGADRFKVEDQNWIPEALDEAANHLDFASYDTNGDGALQNQELSVLVVLNMFSSNISGAGAQANIPLNHMIANTGISLPLFTRTLFSYSSIGVNMHELGHHIFELNHFAPPGDHGLMSTGAYAQDPVVTRLTNTSDRWGTRPTHPIAFSRLMTGAVTPEVPHFNDQGSAQVTLNSIHSGDYNVSFLPTADGYLVLDNRERLGYDASIPFCDQHQGGLFITEVAQYIKPLDLENITRNRESQSYIERFEFCSHYALAGHNDSFSYGGYHFSNISAAGPSMTVQITKNEVARELETFKWRWFKLDPDRDGYRLWWYEEVTELAATVIDFSEIPGGDDINGYFTMRLEGYYNTGEFRSLNSQVQWSSSDPYISLNVSPVTGGEGTTVGDAIVQLVIDPTVACPANRSVTITADLNGAQYRAELTELPCL